MTTPTVRVGQIWRKRDKRVKDYPYHRYLLVTNLMEAKKGAYVIGRSGPTSSPGGLRLWGRKTRIMVRRMKPGASGYELVQEAP